MIVKEYRFAMPLTLDEYERGQRYSVAKASLNETGGGQGVEIVECKPFESDTVCPGKTLSGTYTKKIYHLKEKAPWYFRALFPSAAFYLHEESWNAFPYSKTVITNPGYMKDDFFITFESLHSDASSILENALDLSQETLNSMKVVDLDIANTYYLKPGDIVADTDPCTFRSDVTGRGPLEDGWSETSEPRIVVYKVCTVYFKMFGWQNKVENYIHASYPRLFTKFHREMFCWIDEWYNLTTEELDEHERSVAEQLRRNIKNKKIMGMKAAELETN